MGLSAHGLLVTYHHHHSSLLVLVPPRFIDELESQAVIPKSDVFFKSVFEGTSPFMVKWFKDGIELITGPSCRVRLEKYSSSVELCSVGTLQSGIYSCQVSNEAGTAKSAAQLLVKGWTILFLSTIIAMHLTPSFFSIFHSSSLSSCVFSLLYCLPEISVLFSESPATAASHVSASSIRPITAQVLLYAEDSNLIFFLLCRTTSVCPETASHYVCETVRGTLL